MSVFQATDADFESALSGHEMTIVKFYADWCGSCQLLAPYFSRLSSEERFRGIHFLKVNSEENQNARKMAGVNHLPFFALFRKGEFINGYSFRKAEDLVKMLSQFS